MELNWIIVVIFILVSHFIYFEKKTNLLFLTEYGGKQS